MSIITAVTSVVSKQRAQTEPDEWTITVQRLSYGRWYGPPSAVDVPADVRQALIDWAASPERESEEDR